ncbi:MAG: SCO family protein [Vulcanimicrobiaceae bacterium]
MKSLANVKGPLVLVSLLLAVALASCSKPAQAALGPAPEFSLPAANGRTFSLSAERGRAVALYFGYTHCRDECPTTLARLARAARAFGPAGRRVTIAFITVDPARDSAAVLAAYVRRFGPEVVGLRGTPAQLAAVERRYHISATVSRGRGGAEHVTHDTVVYFIAPDGMLSAIGDASDPHGSFATDLGRLLE